MIGEFPCDPTTLRAGDLVSRDGVVYVVVYGAWAGQPAVAVCTVAVTNSEEWVRVVLKDERDQKDGVGGRDHVASLYVLRDMLGASVALVDRALDPEKGRT